jgi:hypothetical protein
MSTIAAEWIQAGRQEGRQEGQREECIALVTRSLRRKFGPHPELDRLLAQLQALPVEKMEYLAEELLDWKAIGDLTAWLRH